MLDKIARLLGYRRVRYWSQDFLKDEPATYWFYYRWEREGVGGE